MPARGAKHLPGSVGMPAQHLPDADAARHGGQAFQHAARLRSAKRREADIARRDAGGFVQRLQPVDLGERIVGLVPVRFHMHRGDDVLVPRVAAIVLDEIVVPDRPEVTDDRAAGRTQPGMAVHADVPEMMMRVDDGSRVEAGHAALLLTRRSPRLPIPSRRPGRRRARPASAGHGRIAAPPRQRPR